MILNRYPIPFVKNDDEGNSQVQNNPEGGQQDEISGCEKITGWWKQNLALGGHLDVQRAVAVVGITEIFHSGYSGDEPRRNQGQ